MQLLSINRPVTAGYIRSRCARHDSELRYFIDTKPCRQHISFGFIVYESLIAAKRNSETWIHCLLFIERRMSNRISKLTFSLERFDWKTNSPADKLSR